MILWCSYSYICFTVAQILKNKGYLLASMVPWGTFNIHWTFPLHKRL